MAEENLKTTPLNDLHQELGAKMGGFAGFSMPLFYPLGMIKEHLHTRSSAGLFDISHMVHIEIEGDDVFQFLEKLCPLEAETQPIGTCKYTFFLNEDAGIIDDLIVTRLDENRFRIVANAGCAEKDIAHVKGYAADFNVSVNILERGFLALQGPHSEDILSKVGIDASALSFMTAMETSDGWFVSRTGYTGEDGFEIALPAAETDKLARSILSDDRAEAIGLGARDSLRLEAGLSLYGQDLLEDISPLEAGLIWAIPKPLREGGPYMGADKLASQIKQGRPRKRVGLKPKQKIPVRADTTLTDTSENIIGTITSGGFGPSLEYPVAMGLVATDTEGHDIFAEVRGRKLEMDVVKLPFTPQNYKR
ncbi:MAG: glycine cleavage system aminomethyltransferase GcvT [Pseudomonadota bacterium]